MYKCTQQLKATSTFKDVKDNTCMNQFESGLPSTPCDSISRGRHLYVGVSRACIDNSSRSKAKELGVTAQTILNHRYANICTGREREREREKKTANWK